MMTTSGHGLGCMLRRRGPGDGGEGEDRCGKQWRPSLGRQAARLALARTLCHGKPVLVLDDPFSALDRNTEKQVFEHVKELSKDRIVFLNLPQTIPVPGVRPGDLDGTWDGNMQHA